MTCRWTVCLCAAFLLAACQAVPKREKQELAQPVNCATAQQDIATLQSERDSVAERIADGATAVVPAAAALGLLTLQEKDKVEVAAGVYNKRIEEKIAEIEQSCGLG